MQIGRYRILGELGRGATGVVYRAQDPAIGRIIAIKTIRLTDITDAGERDRMRERLFREAQSAGILSHPNIVTIYDIAEEDGLAYIFMECVDGPSLEKILNDQQALDQKTIFSVLRQTATALDYAHKKGIVHRDIKPANILIHEGTTAKIADFGVAKILSQQMTHAGVMMGTPNYMSPEQVQGHAVDGRADQFSLAVVAYEVLTGEKPFVADQLPALLFRIVREDPVPPQRLNPTLAPQVESVLRKALSKATSERYSNCSEFVQALEVACDVNPKWHALPRTVAQTLPTVGGGLPGAGVTANPAAEPPRVTRANELEPAAPIPPPDFLSTTERERSDRNPIVRSLVWMLVGIGLVGLVLFGAQKYLFSRYSEPAPPSSTQAQQDFSASKPSPIGDAPAAAAAPQTPNRPQATAPESTRPAVPATEPAKPETPVTADAAPNKPSRAPDDEPIDRPRDQAARARSAPPVNIPKPGVEQQVQFVTEPANAQLTIDGNSEQSCKTPCLMSLSPGRHSLSARMEGYRPYPRIFSVPDEREIFLQLSKAGGTLSITSSPPGASIEINGETQARRTPALFNYPPGNYRVKVSRNGAFLEFDVQLRDGEFINKKVDF
ncbi:MAG TPA: protein kinase [Bryobacteraceae bacterium]|nr:protein kinase [Bryobacteraceae bacterium]